jgi:hypothetical protein
MRQIRTALIAGAGVLVLCAIAVAWSIGAYVAPQSAVATTHVGPVVAPAAGNSGGSSQPAPLPTTAVTQEPVQPQSSPFPGVPNNAGPGAAPPAGDRTQDQAALARFLEQLRLIQMRRGRHPGI